MKKLVLAIATVSVFALSSCHYGQNEAKQTIERNEQYKTEKADYSVNRAGSSDTEAVSDSVPTPADSTSK